MGKLMAVTKKSEKNKICLITKMVFDWERRKLMMLSKKLVQINDNV